jgi:eukaryotic-like serine/threonine-protein kinase
MDAASWAAVKAAFVRVQEAGPGERPALLAGLDPATRSEVESLLAALAAAPSSLADPVAFTFAPGATIGPYRLLDEIGHGGMGTVFRAERVDGELRRHVALKVAGDRIFAPEAQRRFIQERQILERLEHPNIVRLLDGGVAQGQRYFVMELAEGTPITTHCQERRLPVAQRVELFRQVCAAIQYAHQRLVLHRDIKPANVLVTAAGQVKVLDFGIAQIVREGTLTADTSTAMHPLSFACASPEQLRGETLSLTSDVYSLGTLLYEMLTGVNPQYRPDLSTADLLTRVLEAEPPRPGSVVPAVPRDLDAITLKALSKVPAGRYQSVNELDADLGRWLDGRPVSAVPPRAWYFARRFVRRNKLLTATAVALLASVIVGGLVVTSQARTAERRFEDARRLVHAVVFDIQPRMESIPATLPLRKTLIEQTLTYLESVSRDAGNNVPLLRELANSYVQLGVVQGDALASHLGDRQAAARHFEQAASLMDRARALAPDDAALLADASVLDARRSDFALQNETREVAVRYATSATAHAERSLALSPGLAAGLDAQARAWFSHGRAMGNFEPDAALASYARARAHYATVAARGEVPPREAAQVELFTSNVQIVRKNGEEAVRHGREALRIAQQIQRAHPRDQIARSDLAMATGQLASVLVNSGHEPEASEYFRTAAQLREQILADDPDNVRARERVALAQGRLGTILARAGDYAPALAAIQRSISLYEGLQASGQLAATMEVDFAEVLGHLADYYERTSNAPAKCAALRRALPILETADRRQPLKGFRKQQLEYVRTELANCR